MPLPAAPALVTDNKAESPFSQAVDQFLTELTDGADAKNPFAKEIRAAQQRLDRVNDDGSDRSKAAAIDLQNFVEELEVQKRSRTRRRLLQRLTPFISNLSKLMGICETLLQAAPFGVSVAFTGARVVLGLAVEVGHCFDSVVDGIEEIGMTLKSYEKFADAFRSSPDIQELLVSSYKRIIRFWFNVSRILSTSLLRGAAKSLLAPIDQEIKAALESLKRDGDRISLSAQAMTAQQTERDREARKREGIIRWVSSDSPVDVRLDLRDQADRRQEGTCQWLFDDPRFKTWCESHENAVIWYHANPGSGKTVLAATIIERLRVQGQNTVYFFYSFNSPKRKRGISGLRSLALQLLHLTKFVPQILQNRLDTEMSLNIEGLHYQSTAVAIIHDLLKHGCSDVCVVVDGLDECVDEAETLDSFKSLLALDTYGVVKWFLTSRNQPQIQTTMERCKAQEIKAETSCISQDIRAYLSEYIACSKCVTRMSRDEDNFLYARLICETLRGEGLTSEEEIEQALEAYPKDLNGYYMRVLEKLSERSEMEQDKARRTFLFLVAAAQSVHLNELLDFLAITAGAKDYDRRRVPFTEAIRNLCSPLIIFDKPGQAHEADNPLLKLCHKTVEEFFRQDPDSIDLSSSKLRRYFVQGEQADEIIGLECLTYLQYDRYQRPDIVPILNCILKEPRPQEHAFLAYAATFWAQHLERVSPTPEIYRAVRKFLCSPAFWTCLAVQTRVGRYLFGRYIGGKSSYQYKMGIRGSRKRGDDCFGLPLPRWLDSYSQEGLMLDRSMCYFADEWREVLLTCTDGLQSCLPLRLCSPSCRLDPMEKPRQCRVAHLSQHLPGAEYVLDCRLLGVKFAGKTPWADLLLRSRNRPGRVQHLRIPMFTPKKDMTSKKRIACRELGSPSIIGDYNNWILSLARPDDDTAALEAWQVDSETLGFRRVNHISSEQHEPCAKICAGLMSTKRGKWETRSADDVHVANEHVLAVHMAWTLHEGKSHLSAAAATAATSDTANSGSGESDDDTDTSEEEAEAEEEEEDDDDSSSSCSSSDDDAETNSTGSPVSTAESTNATSTTGTSFGESDNLATDCLLVAPLGGKPYWIPWSTSHSVWTRVRVAAHPTLPLMAVAHTARQVEVIDIERRTTMTKHLPEPPDLLGRPSASVRELRFSVCGKFLHLLRMSFHAHKASTEVDISMSTFGFKADADSDEWLVRHSEAVGYRYRFGETLAEVALPLALTCWSSKEVVIALPPLTCDPRMIKIGLPLAGDDDTATAMPFCALRSPIYFPTSTPRRKARLVYRGAQEGSASEYLCLALDSEGLHRSTPVVLRWKIGELGGWAAWDEERDATASDVKRGMSAWQLLKGEFVDKDKRFSVPIRSGLDWTRKGHLSCAAF